MNDQNLITRAQAGDPDAFGELYDRYIKKIYTFIYYKTSHRETAEDLTGLTFTKAWEHLGGFRGSSFSAWLYSIARNSVIDHYRTAKAEADIEDVYGLSDGLDFSAELDNKIKVEDLKKYFKYLSADQREILMLRVWQELSYKEIAEATGKTEQNCKVIFSRALKELRDKVPLAAYVILLLRQL